MSNLVESNLADPDLVTAVALDLVTQLAPEELPLFRAASQAFQQNPKRVLNGQQVRDDMLGFGLGEAAELLTPVALAVASGVVTFLLAELTKAMNAENAALMQDTVRRLFKRPHAQVQTTDNALPTLTTEQLAQVRSIALKQARQMKLAESRANVLADAIVGKLAITTGA